MVNDASNLQLSIDYETADRITILNLVESYRLLESENREIELLEQAQPYRTKDFEYNTATMQCIYRVIEYYGGIKELEMSYKQNDKAKTD